MTKFMSASEKKFHASYIIANSKTRGPLFIGASKLGPDALFVLSMLFSNSAISDFGSIDLT